MFWGEINVESDDPMSTMWAICIYDAIVFIGVTGEYWANRLRATVDRLEQSASERPRKDYAVIRPAPDGKYRLP